MDSMVVIIYQKGLFTNSSFLIYEQVLRIKNYRIFKVTYEK